MVVGLFISHIGLVLGVSDKLSINHFLTDYQPIRIYTENYRSYQ